VFLRILGLRTAKSLRSVSERKMATNHSHPVGGGVPEDPEDLLPEDSVLDLDEYLAMHAAVGHRTRYEVLYRLVHKGDMSPKELEAAIGIDDSTLHYHLNKLVDVGLVEKRQRTERGQDGLYTYYRATVFGEVTLTEGVDELIRGEGEFEAMYDSSTES
jgi:DNA-binding transcriptional ArsR family regulator